MRLIDADKLIELLNEQKEKETGSYTKGINNGLNIAKSIINDKTQSPTAYDISKVVAELEKLKNTGSVTKTEMLITKACVNKAIDIVRKSGVE